MYRSVAVAIEYLVDAFSHEVEEHDLGDHPITTD